MTEIWNNQSMKKIRIIWKVIKIYDSFPRQ